MTALFSRSRSVASSLTVDQRVALIEQLQAEIVEEQREPTLDELAQAVRDAERAESAVNTRVQRARAELDRLTAAADRIRAEKPKGDVGKQMQARRLAEYDRLMSPFRAELAALGPEVEAARQAVADAVKAAKPYRDAVAKALPANLAALRKVTELRAVEAAQAVQEVEQRAWQAPTLRDAEAALKRLPELTLAAIAAERRRAAVEAMK